MHALSQKKYLKIIQALYWCLYVPVIKLKKCIFHARSLVTSCVWGLSKANLVNFTMFFFRKLPACRVLQQGDGAHVRDLGHSFLESDAWPQTHCLSIFGWYFAWRTEQIQGGELSVTPSDTKCLKKILRSSDQLLICHFHEVRLLTYLLDVTRKK